jgi:5-methyltetrahydropteroyltriglutamate--homocysteine methyltransferase
MKNEYYDSEEAYLAALATALRGEYETIVRRGFLLQLDCPDLALERHLSYQDRPLGDFLGFVERVVTAINTALANIPRDKVRLHVCWGNYEGPHDSDVPLVDILPIIQKANVGGFFFPFANPRHAHEYRVFEKLPLADDQLIIAGVIDSLTNFVEHPEAVADRLERVSAAVGDPHRVIAGTDCGFDTSAGMGRVAEDVVWAKLKALAEGAKIASCGCTSGQGSDASSCSRPHKARVSLYRSEVSTSPPSSRRKRNMCDFAASPARCMTPITSCGA